MLYYSLHEALVRESSPPFFSYQYELTDSYTRNDYEIITQTYLARSEKVKCTPIMSENAGIFCFQYEVRCQRSLLK
jgi:hypothetical protein